MLSFRFGIKVAGFSLPLHRWPSEAATSPEECLILMQSPLENVPVTASRVLVTDYDGTLTSGDFFNLVSLEMLPAGTPDFWAQYLAGQLTHFEMLKCIFGAIRASEAELRALVRRTEIEPRLKELLPRLAAAGWDVVIASAGCEWYIAQLLREHQIELPVYANPGEYHPERGLLMSPPAGDVFYFSTDIGIDKAAIVCDLQRQGKQVAYAGDGRADTTPVLLVPPQWRFARRGSYLANFLEQSGEEFVPFDRWADIAEHLLAAEQPARGQ